MPNYSTINQTPARISLGTQETVYSNSAYGIEFKVPAAWSVVDQDTKFLVGARRNDNVCAADLRLVAWSPILPADSYVRAVSAQLERPESKGSRLVQNAPTTLGALSARDIVLTIEQKGSQITEHQIAARKGMTLYILTMDSLTESTGDCQSDFQFIQQHLALPK